MHKFDLLSEEMQTDPYPALSTMREKSPVCQVEPCNLWALTRFDDVEFAFKNYDIFSSSAIRDIIAPTWLSPDCRRELFVTAEDPPSHTFRRSFINKTFVARIINSLIPLMRETSLQLVKNIKSSSEVDFVDKFSYPFVNTVINRIVGTDDEHHVDMVHKWIKNIEKITLERPDDETVQNIEASIREQTSIFTRIINDRREHPRDDLVTEIVEAKSNDFKLTDDLIIDILDVLVRAGYMTTVHMLSNTVLKLSQNPSLADFLRKNPNKIENFIEEVLRLYTSAPCTMRKTTKPITLHGVTIPKGEKVILYTASANRDHRKFPNPNTIDLNRENIKEHIAFGSGPHVCIGLALARLELNIAIETLLKNTKTIECPNGSHPDWIKSIFIRGLNTLPIRFF